MINMIDVVVGQHLLELFPDKFNLKLSLFRTYLFIYLFYLYIYPPDSQESDGGANT